jgi:hypothetical protein
MGIFGGKHGTSAQAQVLGLQVRSWRQTERRDHDYTLRLEVTVPGQPPFQVETTCTIPYDRVPRVGQVLRVTVAGSDPARVSVDWKSAPSLLAAAQAASAAALAGDSPGVAAAFGLPRTPALPDSADDQENSSPGG